MGKEEDINKIITKLKEGSDEIVHVLVVDKGLNVRSSLELNLSKDEIVFAAKLGVAMKTIEDAMSDLDINCEELVIRSTRSSMIVKRADTAFIIVEVISIVPASPLGLLTESGPCGTITFINNAVKEIKAVLKQ